MLSHKGEFHYSKPSPQVLENKNLYLITISINDQEQRDLNWIVFFTWSNLALLPKENQISLVSALLFLRIGVTIEHCYNLLESLPTRCPIELVVVQNESPISFKNSCASCGRLLWASQRALGAKFILRTTLTIHAPPQTLVLLASPSQQATPNLSWKIWLV